MYSNEPYDEIHDKKLIGFIYLITNLTTGKKYIGRKILWTKKIVRGKRTTVQSDWRSYLGSNQTLLAEAKEGAAFKKEVIVFCKSKSEMNYLETYAILSSGALFKDNYYNDWVSCRVTRRHLEKTKGLLTSQMKLIDEFLLG